MATIDRTGASALIPEEYSRQIIQNLPERSAIMQLARRLPNMSRAQVRMPVLAGLVQGGWVDGEPTHGGGATAGLKRTGRAQWANRYINAEEIAVIVPIPINVLEDADYDIWAEIQPQIEEEFGRIFDETVLFGINAPDGFPVSLLEGATDAGNVVVRGTGADLYDDILSEGGVVSTVEEDGFLVTGHIAALTLRAKLRGLRDDTGQPIFLRSMQETTRYELDGVPMQFPRNGAIDPEQALLFSGDWDQVVWALRTDLRYNVLTEATLYDTDGTTPLYRLAQQDMVALRAVMRIGWQVPNPVNRINPNAETRYPVGVLLPEDSNGTPGGGDGAGDGAGDGDG